MSTNLVMYDIDVFLKKYTRFMTKDIYINRAMYDNFLEPYSYLYKKLERDAILYRENIKYKKMLEIKNNKEKLLKLHNQKYLKRNINNYSSFFESINIEGSLDYNQKCIILSNEDRMLVVNNKNVDYLIVGKIKYLVEVLKVKKNKILILVDDDTKLRKLFKDNDLEFVNLITINEYSSKFLGNKRLVENNFKYNILINYLMNTLFIDKEKFNVLYEAFSNNIYLNKDYYEYDVFNDYHNYMYKRRFLKSKLSLNRFVDKEINKRKNYLRTIKNELVNDVNEVEIANYLCFYDISYEYISYEKLFLINNENNIFKLRVIDGKKIYDKKEICVSVDEIKNGLYKDKLEEEFNIRHIKLKRLKYEDVYNILKDSMIDNYFSEFVNKYLIKYLDYYDINKNFDNTKLSSVQINVLKDVYNFYIKYLEDNNYVTEGNLISLLENYIDKENYKYIVVNSDISLKLKVNIFKIIDDYKDIELIKENIKLLYEYKNYLQSNKVLVGANTYIDELEISRLTNLFFENNLNIINDYFMNIDKRISVYLYDDCNRLYINKNISKECYEIIRKSKDIVVGVNSISEVSSLIYKDYFVKIDRKRLSVNNKKIIDCEEILDFKRSYEEIILPFLIKDSYHENLVSGNNNYMVKLMIYVCLSKCKKELILLCPARKKKEITKILKKIKNVSFFE